MHGTRSQYVEAYGNLGGPELGLVMSRIVPVVCGVGRFVRPGRGRRILVVASFGVEYLRLGFVLLPLEKDVGGAGQDEECGQADSRKIDNPNDSLHFRSHARKEQAQAQAGLPGQPGIEDVGTEEGRS